MTERLAAVFLKRTNNCMRLRDNVHFLFQIRSIIASIGQSWYDEKQNENNYNNFVMTLDGQSWATMMESYEGFARRVKCDEGSISKIMHSSLTDEMKIFKLKDKIKSRVKYWNSWLILVTNVEDLAQGDIASVATTWWKRMEEWSDIDRNNWCWIYTTWRWIS